MKEVKELADFEFMNPHNRNVWFAEKLCNAKLLSCTTTYDGIAALKVEMAKLGYMWESCYVDDGNTVFYKTEFHHKTEDKYGISPGDNEIEATWKAAALALLGG